MGDDVKNPFVYEDALEPGANELVGRESLLDELQILVKKHSTVVLTGTRYVGKTSLLNFLDDQLTKQTWNVLRVDCLGCVDYNDVATKMLDGIDALNVKKGSQVRSSVEAELEGLEKTAEYGADLKLVKGNRTTKHVRGESKSGKDRFQAVLRALCAAYAKTLDSMVVVFDESHYLSFEKDYPLAILKANLKDKGISTVFTGSKRRLLTEMFANDKSPYARRATIMEVHNIRSSAFQSFITQAFQNTDKEITNDALAVLFNKVGLNPQRVQEVASYAWDETSVKSVVTSATIGKAIEVALRRNKPYFINEVKEMQGTAEYELKRAVAKKPAPSLSPRKWFDEMNITGARGYLVRKLTELAQEDEIVFTNKDEYCLRDPLFTLWIRETGAIA